MCYNVINFLDGDCMTTYNTGNPLGSADPRDLYDNAENLDEAVNDLNSETWIDRFGVERITIQGALNRFNDVIIAGGQIFESEEAGRAAVQDGQYFYTVSDDPDVSRELWQRIDANSSELIAEDPSAEGLRDSVLIANAAIDLASQSSRMGSEFYNNDEIPRSLYAITDEVGNTLASWGLDGYQLNPARGEFYNFDSPVDYAITDEVGNPLFSVDDNGQYINKAVGEFYNNDDAPDNCLIDVNNNIIIKWDNDGNFTIPGITAEASGDDYTTSSLSPSNDYYDGPIVLSNSEAVALSPSARQDNDWYYVDGSLLHSDDLPSYTPAAFTATSDFPSGDAESVTVDESANTVTVISNPSNISWANTRLFGFRVDGLEGRNPEFIIGNRDSWNTTLTLARHRLMWSDDPDSDNWRTFDNRIDDPGNNAWRFSNNVDFELNRIYLSHIPNYTHGRTIKQSKHYVRDRLSKRTESANAAYIIGTSSARTSFFLNKPLPETPHYAFKVGDGDKAVAITSGVHPDERPGLYMLEGAANLMLSNSALGRSLRETFTVYFYPAVNLQGLYAGAQRWEAENGQDCNRIWGGSTPSELRTIYETAWQTDLNGKNLAAVFDFHSSPASSPETQAARQLWYNTENTSDQDLLLIEKLREHFDIQTTAANNDNQVSNYIGSTYEAAVRVTSEFNHSAEVSVDEYRQYGGLMLQSLYEIKDQL